MREPRVFVSRAEPGFGRTRDHLLPGLIAAAGLAALAAWRATLSRSAFEDAGKWWLGVAALGLLLISVVYVSRKHLYGTWLGRLRHWYLVHVWAGLVWGPVLVLHAGPVTGGPLYLTLYAAALLTWGSGVLLVLFQWLFLRALERAAASAGLLDDLIATRDRLRAEMAELERGGTLQARIRRLPRSSRGILALFRLLREPDAPGMALLVSRRTLEDFADLGAEDRSALARIAEDLSELVRVEGQIAYQQWRGALLTLHVVSSAPAFGLALVHVVVVARY